MSNNISSNRRATGVPPGGRVNETNPAPNRAAGSGNRDHQLPDVVAAPVVQQPPGAAARRRQPHRLQQEARAAQQQARQAQQANDNRLLMRFQFAHNLLAPGYDQVSGQPELVQHKRMLQLFTAFIEAADALSPQLKAHVGLGNDNLASALAKRASSRYVISQKAGILAHFGDRLAAFADSRMQAHAQDFPPELIFLLDAAEDVVNEASEILTDLRRAIELNPPGDQIALNDRSIHTSSSIIGKSILALMRPATLCTEQCLKQVLGEPAESLLTQERLLYSALFPFTTNGEALNDDRFIQQMRPVLKDAATVCLDLAAFAIDITLPEPGGKHSREEIGQVKARIDATLRDCSALAHLIDEWQQIHPATSLEDNVAALSVSNNLRTGDFVSVLAPSGLHVPAQVQSNGSATTSGVQGLSFKQFNGDFHLIDSADSEAEIDAVQDTLPKPQSLKLTKEIEKAEKLLTQDDGGWGGHLMARKGFNNPDLVMPAYRLQSEKWHKQAERMNKVADRCDRIRATSSNTPDGMRLQLNDLAGRLRERATTLVAKAQEFTRPETRWSLIKAYARPQASQLAELLEAGQVHKVGRPTELKSNPPGQLFEVRIQLQADADGTMHPPVWMHLHAKKAMSISAVRKGKAEDFEAVHLKSDVEKNRGPAWVEAERASGRYDAHVHRSPVGADLLKSLMEFGSRKS
jgi:hypothetical protein